jgi:hypothetical protein
MTHPSGEEPQGRIYWVEPDEEARLLDACRASRTPHLAAVVMAALESGARKGTLLGLRWDLTGWTQAGASAGWR